LSGQAAAGERISARTLAGRLAGLADPRHRRGRRHSFVSVLLIAASAVLAGARSYAAIGQWRNAPQDALARLGARVTGGLQVRIAPGAATIRRIIGSTCPGGLVDLTGTDPAGTATLAVDGKSARGPRRGEVPAAHLLAAMTGDGQTVTQVRVRARRTRSPASPPCRPLRPDRRDSDRHGLRVGGRGGQEDH
jgi:hypothetical protein